MTESKMTTKEIEERLEEIYLEKDELAREEMRLEHLRDYGEELEDED